jgi:NTE family protein
MCDVIADKTGAATRQLSSVPLLSALDESALSAFEAQLDSLSLPGGGILFREGEVGTALYIVAAGSLGVAVRGEDGRDVLVARVQAGETVGEMALLDGGLRSATVVALRDTELLRLERHSYERLIEQYPRSMLPLVSMLVRRLRIATHHRGELATVRTIALLPLDAEAERHSLARDLADRFADDGQRVRLLDRKSAAHTTHWFNAAEVASDLVLYCSELIESSWTKLCLRQADRVLLIASSHRAPQATWLASHTEDWRRPMDLVVLHANGRSTAQSAAEHWHQRLQLGLVCHVRHGKNDDIGRLARLLRGKSIGLVLSAGGARGFAHLGIVRALREARVPIDLIGGCSMGAIAGAAVALEWDDAEIRERLRAFVKSNPINDYTLPFLALAKGRKLDRQLDKHFGGIRIEDLWRPFFRVSTNLTAGALATHRKGPLAVALRASVSIPGLLPPVMIAGNAHVDGGIMDHLPIDVMRPTCGTVIAADVASDLALAPFAEGGGRPSLWQFLCQRARIPPIVDLLVRAATVSSEVLARTARGQADILFKPPLENVGLLDWEACDTAIEAGYRSATQHLEHLDKAALLPKVPAA